MKYGIREICDVVLKAKANQKIGNKIFYKDEPVLYFDTLKTSTMEGAATTVYAQGGRGNSRLVAWEGERTVTFTMEDALISPTGFSILSGAGLIEASENNKIKVHKAEIARIANSFADNEIRLELQSKIYGSNNYNIINPQFFRAFTSSYAPGKPFYGIVLLKEHLEEIKKYYLGQSNYEDLDSFVDHIIITLPEYQDYISADNESGLKSYMIIGLDDADFKSEFVNENGAATSLIDSNGEIQSNITGVILNLKGNAEDNNSHIYGFTYHFKEPLNPGVYSFVINKIEAKAFSEEDLDRVLNGSSNFALKTPVFCGFEKEEKDEQSNTVNAMYLNQISSYNFSQYKSGVECIKITGQKYAYDAVNEEWKNSETSYTNIQDILNDCKTLTDDGYNVYIDKPSDNVEIKENDVYYEVSTPKILETKKVLFPEGVSIKLERMVDSTKAFKCQICFQGVEIQAFRGYITAGTNPPKEKYLIVKGFQGIEGQSELENYVPYIENQMKSDLSNVSVIQNNKIIPKEDIKRIDDGHYLVLNKINENNLDNYFVDYYTEVASGVQQIEITPDKFGCNYYLEAATLFRTQDGTDVPANFIIPNCKIQSNFNFTMASSGDPSTFTFTMDAFPDYLRFDKSKKVLAAIQLINDNKIDSSTTRDRTKSNIKLK